ncbi:MAG: DUF192 domain-containing protein [Candidatus Moraniibacteriota bacterium]
MNEEKAPKQSEFLCKRMYFLDILCIVGIVFFLVKNTLEKAPSLKTVWIAGALYHLEIANTQEKRAKGLGDRESLCDDCGMLFTFDVDGQYAFWMKAMRFPIDIIWLRNDEVVFVAEDVSPESLDTLNPQVTANQVLEINAGKGKDIHVGEKVRFE